MATCAWCTWEGQPALIWSPCAGCGRVPTAFERLVAGLPELECSVLAVAENPFCACGNPSGELLTSYPAKCGSCRKPVEPGGFLPSKE